MSGPAFKCQMTDVLSVHNTASAIVYYTVYLQNVLQELYQNSDATSDFAV